MASPNGPFRRLTGGAKQSSARLIISYILDWICIVVVAGAGGVLYKIRGNEHAFSLEDISISYPLKANTVSITVVGFIACVAPAGIIVFFSLILPPGDPSPKSNASSIRWRQKLWSWNAGWMGLGVSLAGAFFVTSGLKDLVGKPRPDFIARCNPDVSAIAKYQVGGLGQLLKESPVIVDVGICQQTDYSVLQDGFASFPSGHSSFAWAGLLYLTFWLSAKLAVAIPARPQGNVSSKPGLDPFNESSTTWLQNVGAAPPIYLLVTALLPLGAAIYVAASRWNDYQHHGFDIIAGSLIGGLFAWFGFRMYHLPIRRGGGWAWGPRSHNMAFYIGPGSEGFAQRVEWTQVGSNHQPLDDIELSRVPGS